jgi:hypothetical protein
VRFGAAVAAGIGMLCARPVGAQSPTAIPRFERVSVEPSRSADSRRDTRFEPEGRWRATNFTLRELIELAYQRHGFDRREVSGGPAWIDSERFDVTARAAQDHVFERDGFPRQTWLMLRAALAEKFKLGVAPTCRSGRFTSSRARTRTARWAPAFVDRRSIAPRR